MTLSARKADLLCGSSLAIAEVANPRMRPKVMIVVFMTPPTG
jgi:hypothetical protein